MKWLWGGPLRDSGRPVEISAVTFAIVPIIGNTDYWQYSHCRNILCRHIHSKILLRIRHRKMFLQWA